jgi:hypothetical protein
MVLTAQTRDLQPAIDLFLHFPGIGESLLHLSILDLTGGTAFHTESKEKNLSPTLPV